MFLSSLQRRMMRHSPSHVPLSSQAEHNVRSASSNQHKHTAVWIPSAVLLVVLLCSVIVVNASRHLPAHASVGSAGGQGFTNGGLTGQYFLNENLSGTPAFTRQDVRINFNWGYFPTGESVTGSPSLPFSGGAFSIKWTGQILAAYSQTYTFTTESDDGVRLFVNGQEIINDWNPHAPTTDTGTINLNAGQKYDIELDYFQAYGGARIILSWSSLSTPQAVIEPAIGMGVNVSSVCDYCGDLLFTNIVEEARAWGDPSAPWQNKTGVTVDTNGWPQTDAGLVILDPPTDVTGTYALSFTGQAQSIFGVASNVQIQNKQYNASTNTTTATLIQGSGQMDIGFTGTQRQPSDPLGTGLTNLKIMMPTSFGGSTDYDPSVTFTDLNKAILSKFSVLRFMDPTWTNGNLQVNWSDRRLPTYATQAASGLDGLSWEYVIQLCNEVDKDAYINVPAEATDDYVTHLANLFKYGSDANGNVYTSPQSNPAHPPLNPNLNLYIEYSNEVWNFSFVQAGQNHDAAQAEVAAGNSPLNYDGSTNTYEWAWRRVGERIKQISDLFRAVWGDNAMPNNAGQIRPILEWQYGNAQDTAHQELSFLNNYYNNADGIQHVSNPEPLSYYLWGGGGAAYSGVNNPGASTIDDIYNSGYSTSVVPNTIKSDVQFIHAYGLQHDIAYEGGFQIGGDNPSTLQQQANVDPRAQQMEQQTQTLFNQAGGDLLVYYNENSTNYGLAYPDAQVQNTPKLQAIDALNSTAQSAPSLAPSVTSGAIPIGSTNWFGAGARDDLSVINPNTGSATYDLTINIHTTNGPNTIRLLINGSSVQSVTTAVTSAADTDVDFGSVTLNSGLNVITLLGIAPTGTFINSMTFH